MPESSKHAFDEAVRLQALGNGAYRGHTSEHYWNFAGPLDRPQKPVSRQSISLNWKILDILLSR